MRFGTVSHTQRLWNEDGKCCSGVNMLQEHLRYSCSVQCIGRSGSPEKNLLDFISSFSIFDLMIQMSGPTPSELTAHTRLLKEKQWNTDGLLSFINYPVNKWIIIYHSTSIYWSLISLGKVNPFRTTYKDKREKSQFR